MRNNKAVLNEYNEKTKKVIHLMVTSLCDRNCPHCCNKQYDLNDIPYVTDEELKQCEVLCLTGGEPFAYTKPNEIAGYYKQLYPNIKKVYVYTNAMEFFIYSNTSYANGKLKLNECLNHIDGLNVSIKTYMDLIFFNMFVDDINIFLKRNNRLYIFDDVLMPKYTGNFKVIKREWQENFKPADDSIFRKI